MYLIVLKQLGVMAVIALAGFAAAKAFGFGKKEQTFVSKLLLYVINPCLILHTNCQSICTCSWERSCVPQNQAFRGSPLQHHPKGP